MRIAIIQTGCFGDNINSTLMLKPLHSHFSDCTIDIHTSSLYWSAFHNNPYINKTHIYEAKTKQTALDLSKQIPTRLFNYDLIFNPHPLFNQDKRLSKLHPEWGTSIINAWVRALEDEEIEYEVPLETILKLDEEEVAGVDEFWNKLDIAGKKCTIMEVEGESGQTFWNREWTNRVVELLCSRGEVVFISHKNRHQDLEVKFPGLCYSANSLSIRQCAELFNRCDRFISVSSGLSNACNTNWCKNSIEWIEVVKGLAASSALIRSNGKRFLCSGDLQELLDIL